MIETNQIPIVASKVDTACYHCGELAMSPIISEELSFCCNGCKTVHAILKANNLEQYYDIKNAADVAKIPVNPAKENFLHMRDENFIREYAKVTSDGKMILDFYLEGIHCLACLWLIEKIPELVDGVISSRLNLESSRARFVLHPRCDISVLAGELNRLGYLPHAIKQDDEVEAFKKKEERDLLIRMGVAMACMGNIVLLSISIYAGAEGTLKTQFEWLSFFLLMPVILYCAVPFYANALSALKRKTISIDLPISIALIAGTIGGFINLLKGNGIIFFDSMASLVFLLFLGRYLLLKARQKGVNSSNLEYFNSFGSVKRANGEEVLAKFLKPQDVIILTKGDMVPVDGEILAGTALVNNSLLTGESVPINLFTGSLIFSGTQVMSGEVTVRVEKTGRGTRLGGILEEVDLARRMPAPMVTLADKWAQWFVIVVLLLAAAIMGYFAFAGNLTEGFLRALTLVIITCPCALALATPLALTSVIGKLAGQGVIIRSEEVIEKLSKANKIFLDKTGTLTYGKFQVVSFKPLRSFDNLSSIVYTLEKDAIHPIGVALVDYLKDARQLEITDWKEIPGFGVTGIIDGKSYQIKRHNNFLGLFEDGEVILEMELQDSLRKDSKVAIEKMRELKVRPYLLSGDSRSNVLETAKELEISSAHCYFEKKPEEKNKIVTEKAAIMVGDGANDALALSKASVGIAVKGSIDVSLKAADIYLTKPGVALVTLVLTEARKTLKVIHRNLIFSISYNFIGAGLAITGHLNPLWAAILMPLSSLTVLFSTIWGTGRAR
ncbi:MAG: cadmium-translocating P-type ATPase [Epsilonproteobacteria bacterium]|nr:MAG: cadmium-translocating P-type ATPase [Campylobacterota bacterium]RLA65349.1 MAG: cadmium-translocating P-type ATPase [Campylobacterota bacterium]